MTDNKPPKWHCDECNVDIDPRGKLNHLKSNKHLNQVRKNEKQPEAEPIKEEPIKEEPIKEVETMPESNEIRIVTDKPKIADILPAPVKGLGETVIEKLATPENVAIFAGIVGTLLQGVMEKKHSTPDVAQGAMEKDILGNMVPSF